MIALKLIPVSINELRDLIEFSYTGDVDLIQLYQAEDRTFEECVNFNFEEIRLTVDKLGIEVKMLKVVIENGADREDIGYCVIVFNEAAPPQLFSYAININYRKKVFMKDFLPEVEKRTGQVYYTALWERNSRAKNFFKNNGFEEMPQPEKYSILAIGADDNLKKQMKWQ